MHSKNYFTYILINRKNGALYIGVTSDLLKRVYQHKQKEIEGFTSKYGIDMLIYYEECNEINAAIAREKQLKKWKRAWKLELIENFNPRWADLYTSMITGSPLSRG